MKNFLIFLLNFLFCVFLFSQTDDELIPAPKLSFIQAIVDDSSGGNNNGILEPGESVILQVRIFNYGTATAYSVIGNLYSDEPGITFIDRVATFGDIKPKEIKLSQSPHFSISLSSSFPCGKKISFRLLLDGTNTTQEVSFFLSPRSFPERDMAKFVEEIIVYGADSYDYAGYSVSAGDINGDGYEDVILGAPYAGGPSNGRYEAGEVWVIYGSNSPLSSIDLSTPPANSTVIYGADSYDRVGNSVSAGDINGDGYEDVILGASYADGPSNGRANAGEVWVIYGKSSMPASIDLSTPPANSTVIYGADSGDRAGNSVSAGDINGDGYEDIILGAYHADGPSNGRADAGEVWVIYGKSSMPSSIDLSTSPSNSTVIYGADSGDYAGNSVSAGDINGDGYEDVILGAPYAAGPSNGRYSAGEVWVIYGKSSMPGTIDLSTPPANSTVIYGADSGDNAGYSVSAGDINGDGYEDVILGAWYANGPSNGRAVAGEVWAIYGKSSMPSSIDLSTPPANSTVIYGADSYDWAGYSVSAGDINGDGYEDIILGALYADGPSNGRASAGEVAVLFGRFDNYYYIKSDTYAFIDASGGTNLNLNCDSCCKEIEIGFTFYFYDEPYQKLYVCDDGYISFTPVSHPQAANFCLPDRHSPDNLIAVFWDDLNPSSGGNIYWLLEGTEPQRRITIEWKDVPHYPNIGAATFEVTLFEGSNQILVQYQDTIFGSSSDSGANATAGLENRTGINGQKYSCFASNLISNTAWRAIPFGIYNIFSDYMESGINGWSTDGTPVVLWHQESASCAPYNRSPYVSWYYGQGATCNYNTGTANSGNLTSPQISSDYYSDMSWWFRRQTEGSASFDLSYFQISDNGGPYLTVAQILINDNLWHPGQIDISSHSGKNINLRFRFDTVNSISNDYLGWMIDNVEVYGCNVYGTNPVINPLAYARPTPVCETNSYLLDGSGTYVNGCNGSVNFQWYEDDLSISGANTIQYTMPSGHSTGLFKYYLKATCTDPFMEGYSNNTYVRVVPMPLEVPETSFKLTKQGSGIKMVWENVQGGDLYTIYRDTNPAGSFTEIAGQAADGTAGAVIPMPSENFVCFLVAARNDTCGEGPKR